MFDASSIAQQDRFEAWRDSQHLFTNVKPLDDAKGDLSWSFQTWRIGDLVLGSFSMPPFRAVRSTDHLRRSMQETLAVRMFLSGGQKFLLAEEPVLIRSGEIHVIDMQMEFHQVTVQETEMLAAYLPYSAVGFDPSRHPRRLRIDAETAIGRVLSAALHSLHGAAPYARRREEQVLATGLYGLLRGLIFQSPTGETDYRAVANARREAVRKYIDDHINDPNLGLDMLCETFAASRSTIYRMFRDQGGVDRYLIDRRLIRAYQELARTPEERGAVNAIAARWRFFDTSHFSRLFRERFELRPSDVLSIGLAN